jgi:hypothetical protein
MASAKATTLSVRQVRSLMEAVIALSDSAINMPICHTESIAALRRIVEDFDKLS